MSLLLAKQVYLYLYVIAQTPQTTNVTNVFETLIVYVENYFSADFQSNYVHVHLVHLVHLDKTTIYISIEVYNIIPPNPKHK